MSNLQKNLEATIKMLEPGKYVASGIWSLNARNPEQVLCTTTPIFHSVTVTCSKGPVVVHLVGHDRMPPGGTEDRPINAMSSTTAGCVYARVFLQAPVTTAEGFYIVAKE